MFLLEVTNWAMSRIRGTAVFTSMSRSVRGIGLPALHVLTILVVLVVNVGFVGLLRYAAINYRSTERSFGRIARQAVSLAVVATVGTMLLIGVLWM